MRLPLAALVLGLSTGAAGIATSPELLPKDARLGARLTAYGRSYRALSKEHYLATATVQSGVLRGASDALAQTMHGVPVDLHHVASIATLGTLVSGYGGALWLRHLEEWRGSDTSLGTVASKAATDFTHWAPVANSAYLLGVPLLTAAYAGGAIDLCAALSTWAAGFGSVMALEASIFGPYNLLAFRCVPASLRPQISTCLSVVFTVALSDLC